MQTLESGTWEGWGKGVEQALGVVVAEEGGDAVVEEGADSPSLSASLWRTTCGGGEGCE